MMRAVNGWVQFWDRREAGDTLAVVRIAVGLTLLCDYLTTARLGLVSPLWAPSEEHGFGPSSYGEPMCLVYEWFGASAAAAWTMFLAGCVSAAAMTVGLFTRSSALVLVLVSGQLAQLQPAADRGIDTLLRNACLLLAMSDAGATLSAESRLRRGRWCSEVLIASWPRYLIVLQLAVLYFQAGMLKQASSWTSLDHYSALYVVLLRPHFARFALSPQVLGLFYPVLQAATLITLLFERGAILVPACLWLHETRHRGGKLRALAVRSHLLQVWIVTGVGFHLGLAVLMQLGIFPWGCLALYPALVQPAALRRFAARALTLPGFTSVAMRDRRR